jgi:hypothetical protein
LGADLLLVAGEPEREIEATRAIVTIWKNGRAVDRSPAAAVAEQAWEAGPVSDFDDGTLASRTGLGWSATTDRMAGGGSDVALTPVAGGVAGDGGAMRVAGTVVAGAPYPWAGAMLSPGPRLFAPVDARARRELVFQARGDGREVALLLFSGAEGARPAMRPFTPGPEWREVRLPLADFAGVDLGALRGVGVTAGLPAGTFWFELDAVEIR